jgi:ATP-dependent Lon protease
VLIPRENEKDLAEIPENVKQGLEIIPVDHVRDVLRLALVRAPEPVEWDEAAEEAASAEAARQSGDAGRGAVAH